MQDPSLQEGKQTKDNKINLNLDRDSECRLWILKQDRSSNLSFKSSSKLLVPFQFFFFSGFGSLISKSLADEKISFKSKSVYSNQQSSFTQTLHTQVFQT